ncbi:hypothetical protein DPMN_059574 [Dreissena polymorpha]|uniref:Uncharacterized protein n=1 Tax=Dreissena polymorpha TaxID=45954 RepID=A0A9D4C3Q8_DREPO|nr:hypothetical protein DPMN_059574 [Dreissena polymorpha]
MTPADFEVTRSKVKVTMTPIDSQVTSCLRNGIPFIAFCGPCQTGNSDNLTDSNEFVFEEEEDDDTTHLTL